MPTLYLPPDTRRPFHMGPDGKWTTYKDDDAVVAYTVDWTDILDGDTISTSTWTVDEGGITLSGAANTTTTTSITVTESGGVAKNVIVTAASLTHVRRLEFLDTDK